MAAPMSPLIFSLPPMKAIVGLSLPVNMATRSPEEDFITVSASTSLDSAAPTEPSPFFKSRNQLPGMEDWDNNIANVTMSILWDKRALSRHLRQECKYYSVGLAPLLLPGPTPSFSMLTETVQH